MHYSTVCICIYHIYLNASLYGAQWLRIAQSKRSTRLGTSLPENRKRATFWKKLCFFKHTDDGHIPKRRLSVSFSPALVCLPFTHGNLAMQALVWLHMVQFRVIHFGTVQIGTSYANLRWPHIFKEKKNLSCIQVNKIYMAYIMWCVCTRACVCVYILEIPIWISWTVFFILLTYMFHFGLKPVHTCKCNCKFLA